MEYTINLKEFGNESNVISVLNKDVKFEINMISEGIVWTTTVKSERFTFKTKGEKHAGKSKVKTLKPVDDEKINKIIGIVNQVTPTWRLDQMINETFDTINGGQIEVKGMGNYIKAVMKDIVKEEMVVLVENGVEPKDIGKYVAEVAKAYFFERFNAEIGIN